ncbi:unnamed protein product [Prorocentrum cordatum]|uniref:Uncharacterized protein n=1 Tax=Prorocentrum cordatum TaxID=2364126 RepID=A0ABN9Y5C0_9DINO|nr:unnamed protein product [Polarella glacialis]
MLHLWDAPCPPELSCEVVSSLGPLASMELRCVSQKLRGLMSHRLLRRAAESRLSDGAAAPLCERVRAAAACDDDLALAVLSASARSGLDEANVHGQTALMWAAGRGCAPLCSLLLAEGALTEAIDSGGWTALFRAAWHGRRAAISVLIRAGADVNCQSARVPRWTAPAEYTPLMAAARFGHAAVVERLLLAGADAARGTVLGETALSLAQHRSHQAVVALLRGARPAGAAAGRGIPEPWVSSPASWALVPASCRRHAVGAVGWGEAQRAFEAALAGS